MFCDLRRPRSVVSCCISMVVDKHTIRLTLNGSAFLQKNVNIAALQICTNNRVDPLNDVIFDETV